MKKGLTIAAVLTVAVITTVFAFKSSSASPGNGEGVKWENITSGINSMKSGQKKMVMDVYTDWCGWCKKMDKATYSDASVVKYIGSNFVAVKLNAESPNTFEFKGQKYSEQQFAQALGVTGYPATVFFDEKGEPITVVPGYIEGKEFLKILKYFEEDAYKTKSFEEFSKNIN